MYVISSLGVDIYMQVCAKRKYVWESIFERGYLHVRMHRTKICMGFHLNVWICVTCHVFNRHICTSFSSKQQSFTHHNSNYMLYKSCNFLAIIL